MLKVLYFRTYPPFSTSGHPHGRLATRMDTSVHKKCQHYHIYTDIDIEKKKTHLIAFFLSSDRILSVELLNAEPFPPMLYLKNL